MFNKVFPRNILGNYSIIVSTSIQQQYNTLEVHFMYLRNSVFSNNFSTLYQLVYKSVREN